jgi:hypothetical protein
MKYFIYVSLLLLPIITKAQSNIGIIGGAKIAFSEYIDIQIDPPKVMSSIQYQYGLYYNYKSNNSKWFLESGFYFNKLSNHFKLYDAPYFPYNQGFNTINHYFWSFQVPLKVGMIFKINPNISIETYIGTSFNFNARRSFIEEFSNTMNETINDEQVVLDYNIFFRSINDQYFMLNTGSRLLIPINKKISFVTQLEYNIGLRPILISVFDYKITNVPNNSTFVGDGISISKGDAVLFNVGIEYKL